MGYNGASTVVQGNSIIFLTQLYQGKQAQAKWMTLHVCKFLLSLTTNEDPANLVQWCLEMWHYLICPRLSTLSFSVSSVVTFEGF